MAGHDAWKETINKLGSDEQALIRKLRASCFAYTALILIESGSQELPTPEEIDEIHSALAAVAHCGHDLVEAARARSN
jgi:hypothetical protein